MISCCFTGAYTQLDSLKKIKQMHVETHISMACSQTPVFKHHILLSMLVNDYLHLNFQKKHGFIYYIRTASNEKSWHHSWPFLFWSSFPFSFYYSIFNLSLKSFVEVCVLHCQRFHLLSRSPEEDVATTRRWRRFAPLSCEFFSLNLAPWILHLESWIFCHNHRNTCKCCGISVVGKVVQWFGEVADW